MSDNQQQLGIVKADLIGECLKCDQPAKGSFDFEKNGETVEIKCVECGTKYLVKLDSTLLHGWQDEIK